ncbi:MAG: Stp1/IreP family PP2C-type Ser/Thr phosphatase [Sulfuricaulis sp.]|uniref:Stp1/IreP family PP2C-type Ser/Thr phosphatase n=1 Tax=Sulfuricaulis sp. TaxID=2003553 RepID=UPI0034A5A524
MNELLMIGLTDPGRIRAQNEDHIACVPEAGLAVIADGMGGHKAGEVASKYAVEIIRNHVIERLIGKDKTNDHAAETEIVGEAIQQANEAIYKMAQAQPECAGMGSTVVVTVFYGDRFCVGHVGDSRLYRFRDNLLSQVTQDHSVVQELVSRGLATADEARMSVSKNLVTRALGVEPTVVPDIAEQMLHDDDTFLLCSDGLNEVLADGDIEMLLMEHRHHLESAVKQMVALANERGAPDNVSAIAVQANRNFVRDQGKLQALRFQA